MATIKQRKTNFSVIYWYLNADGIRKQKWDTVSTRAEAKRRKTFVEFYQQENGQVLVPTEEAYRLAQEHPEAAAHPRSSAVSKSFGTAGADITVMDFLKVFVKVYGTATWSLSTYASKCSSIEHYINPYIGDWKLREVTTARLSEYYNMLLSVPEVPKGNRQPDGRCVQPAGVKKIHDIIRCALNQAIRWEYLDSNSRNPATLATLPKDKKRRRKVWTVEVFREAVGKAEDPILSLAMHLAFSCSLRYGEIAGLTWDDVVIDENSIESGDACVHVSKELSRVTAVALQNIGERDVFFVFPTLMPHCTTRLVLKAPKTESSVRTVWLPKTVARMLVEHRRSQEEMREFIGESYNDYNLVLALDNGNPVESRIIRRRFEQLCDENGFERVVFHSLRHLSTGYKLKMTGGDVKSVQGDTGHAEAEMVTDVYSEIVDQDRRRNAQKMESDFYGGGDPSSDEEILRLLRGLPPERVKQLLAGIGGD